MFANLLLFWPPSAPPTPGTECAPPAPLWLAMRRRRRRNAPQPTNLKQAIVAQLNASSSVATLLGGNLFPVVIPQTASLAGQPALTYRFVGTQEVMNLQRATGMATTRVRFRVESFTHGDLESVKAALRNLFLGFSSSLAGVFPVVMVTFEDQSGSDDYDEPLVGSDLGTHWKEFDFLFKYRDNNVPTNT